MGSVSNAHSIMMNSNNFNQQQQQSSSLNIPPQSLMRNPGSEIDLTSLYSLNNSMPNVPVRAAPLAPGQPQMALTQSTQDPFSNGTPVFSLGYHPDQGSFGSAVSSQPSGNFNPFNDNFSSDWAQDLSSKKMLSKVDSVVSYTEPGPVQFGESVKSTTEQFEFSNPNVANAEEFMRILERNSNVLLQAAEKNKQIQETRKAAEQSADDHHDSADLDSTNQEQEVKEETEKIVGDDPKEEQTPAKKGLFRFWNSADKAKSPGTPPNSPNPSTPVVEQQGVQGRGGNEQKFMGEGQLFKGKLIGVLEVQEARGDRMCQDALAELKTAIKASGEHKQKVLIHIAVDGLKIRDEKTGDCLYHHPVHKISFIAQDMSDNRAFGYIYGSPENGHRFFGIKTEKAAGQVVVAMRDLFQVVFELKQKEIDDAIRKMDKDKRDMLPHHPGNFNQPQGNSVASFPDGPSGRGQASGALSDLLGLENELTSIQAGIRQIDKIAPSAPMSFQTDSMIPIGSLQPSSNFPTTVHNDPPQHLQQPSQNHQSNHQTYPGLPHAPTANQVKDLGATTAEAQTPINPALMTQAPLLQRHDPFGATPFLPPPPSKANRANQQGRYHFPPGPEQGSVDDKYAVFESLSGSFNTQHLQQQQMVHNQGGQASNLFSNQHAFGGQGADTMFARQQQQLQQQQQPIMTSMVSSMESSGSGNVELFTDLDPLGTGKSRPYVDKKDFFSELKTSSPKLGNVSSNSMSRESPVNNSNSTSLDFANVGQQQQPADMSLSTCPTLQSQSNVPCVANNSSSSRSSSMRSSSGCPIPPPRSGSELTYGHLDQVQRSSTSSDTMPRQIRNFGFSAQLTQQQQPRSTTNTITSLASSWRTGNQPSGLHDTRLYHTLGRPMTTFTKVYETYTTSSAPLKVSLPPDSPRVSQEQDAAWPASEQSNGRYGSIPQLEASPRRYNRSKDQSEYIYDTSGHTLGVPARAPADGASSSDVPPKLPEKPSRRINQASPPPLPPKKPIKGLIGIVSYRRPSMEETPPQPDVVLGAGGQDIYDFPPMPMLGSFKMDKEEAEQCITDILQSSEPPAIAKEEGPKLPALSVEDLSKMSLIDLNAKLMSGQLPQELKGMSILELVEFINKEMMKAVMVKKEETSSMKPSFSDNFVCDSSNVPRATIHNTDHNATLPILESNVLKETLVPPGPLPNEDTSQPVSISLNNNPSGFDDDFTPFSISMNANMSDGRPDSQAASDHSVLSQSRQDEYDKYAVFRELQMEEELIRAWKTPSDEEKREDDEEEEEEQGDLQEEEEQPMRESYNNQPICSSEGSPCSRSDTQSPLKSYTADDQYQEAKDHRDAKDDQRFANNYEEEGDDEEEDDFDEEHPHHDTKRDSQVPIFHQGDEDEDSVCQSIKSSEKGLVRYSNQDNDEEVSLFSSAFESEGGVQEPPASRAWTTFDDGDENIIIKQAAPKQQSSVMAVAPPKENLFQDNFGDSMDWGQTPPSSVSSKKPPSRQLSTDSQKSSLSHQGKCHRFSHRSIDGSHICRGHSLETSEHEDSSNYTDWWPPSAEGAPTQKKKSAKVITMNSISGAGNEAYSATPDHKAKEVEEESAWGVPAAGKEGFFGSDPLEAKFKVFSKIINPNGFDRSHTPNDAMSDNDSGIIPKSDSVNIFSIKDDPFDDDFFQ